MQELEQAEFSFMPGTEHGLKAAEVDVSQEEELKQKIHR